ncbi:MAG: DNA internalization-related competence protein ComEC/Rec2 [Gemmatimonadales bacterium]
MPAIVLAAAGFVAGVLAGLSVAPALWPAWSACAVAAAVLWARSRSVSIVCLGLAAGGMWGASAAARGALSCAAHRQDGERVALIVEPWDRQVPGRRALVRVRWPDACRATLATQFPAAIPGPRGTAAIVGAWYRGPARGAAWWPVRAGAGGWIVVRRSRPLDSTPSVRARLRLDAEDRLAGLFGEERFPLVSALTLGSSSQLDRPMRATFARAGLAHILAISGLHVAILAAALVTLLRLAGVPPARARLLAVPAIAGYVWLLGLPPPALRAAWLLAVWELARARQRPPLRSGVLAVTALGVAVLDPFAVAEVGPWLSFAGAWGAAEGARWWDALDWTARVREGRFFGVGQMAAVSLGATLATAPVSALAFGTVATAAVVTNLVAVPTVGVAVPALALSLGLSFMAAGLARLAAAAAGVALDLLEMVAVRGSALPFATVTVAGRATAVAALLGLFWLWRRIALPRRLAPYPAIARWRAATAAAVLGAAGIWWPVIPHPGSGFSPGRLEIDFLPVGQGDAAVLHTPGGRWILVDGGPRVAGHDAGATIVVPYLRDNGVRRLSAVVSSHGDADHLGGLPAVLRAFPADLVLEPGEPRTSGLYREWLSAVARAGARWRPARAGDSLAVDGVVLRVLHPDSAWMTEGLPANENGVVLRVEFGAFRALFPGDAGFAMETARAASVGPVTLLKVAHHGSRSATGAAWLAALVPRVCVVSVGVNTFGQPAAEVLAALAAAGCRTFRTDADGRIRVSTDGRGAWVRTREGTIAVPLDHQQGAM